MKNKKGFTLIELLVVVLIIGILAGIAVPQYRNAVRKARVAEAQIILKDVIDAEDRWILQYENFEWNSWENLDIEVPNESQYWSFEQEECIANGCGVYAIPKWEEGYQIEYWSNGYDNIEGSVLTGKFLCAAYNEEGIKKCSNIGKEKVLDNGPDDTRYRL